MNDISKIRIFIFCSLAVFVFGCKAGKIDEVSTETDTRILVKKAIDSIDLNSVPSNFNMKRAMELKNKIDKEPDGNKQANMGASYATELLKAGEINGALSVFQGMLDYIEKYKIKLDSQSRRNLYSQMGISYMRQGEIENCVQNHNHQSCFIPVAGEGVHQLQSGSRNAIIYYDKILKEFPDDLETKYLINIAYMTLGEYPDKVPKNYRIDPSWFQNKTKIQPFIDIAPQLGVNRKSLAGGTIVDDFNNDGWLDIIASSWSPTEELVFYLNNGNGTFTDETKAYKLDGQVACLHLNQTDFNNDGWLDIFLMRGAWYGVEGDIPSTLLMNTGKGYFEDVTIKSGLTHNASSQNAAWADFNLDGWLDVAIGN
ncbi:MAG TPA: VCBS repeat-containing protein, partial [Saprospiraceae bacterium]|nr:VCBS repeat-containing protein [Saprospiraceae bacterium]